MLSKIKAKTPIAVFALVVAIGVAIVFAVGNQIIYHQFDSLATQRRDIWHTRFKLSQTLSLLTDIETGGRGYALTGKADFLAPYNAASSSLLANYQEFKGLADSVDCCAMSWDELDKLISLRMELTANLIDLRTLQGKTILNEQALLDTGKQTMDSIRSIFSRLDTTLEQRITGLNTDMDLVRERAIWIGWLSMLSIAMLIVCAGFLLNLERMARRILEEGLRNANLNLEQRVAKRTEELSEAKSRIAAFAVEQEQLIEAERKRLSREVHDQIGATFAGLKLILRSLPEGCIPVDETKALLMAVDMGVATARRIATELRPPLLDDLGLQAALEQLLETMFHSGCTLGAVDLKHQDKLSHTQAIGLYRIVQEAVSNVVRHAKARHFMVRGDINGDGCYKLMMADDGVGLGTVKHRVGALGLAGMRERAELMRGNLTIENGPDGGVSITLHLPLVPRKNSNAYENTAA